MANPNSRQYHSGRSRILSATYATPALGDVDIVLAAVTVTGCGSNLGSAP